MRVYGLSVRDPVQYVRIPNLANVATSSSGGGNLHKLFVCFQNRCCCIDCVCNCDTGVLAIAVRWYIYCKLRVFLLGTYDCLPHPLHFKVAVRLLN